MNLLLRRLLFNVTPLLLMAGVICMAIFGDHGLIRRHHLRAQHTALMGENDTLARQNAELRRQLRVLDARPEGVRRLAAQELLMAPEGSTLYRFEEEPDDE